MTLTQDLLNDDLYAPESPDGGQPTRFDEDEDEGQNPDPDAVEALNANGRRARRDSNPDSDEEARINRRSFMETSLDHYNVRGADRELGRIFADVSTLAQPLLVALICWCSLTLVGRLCIFLASFSFSGARSITLRLSNSCVAKSTR